MGHRPPVVDPEGDPQAAPVQVNLREAEGEDQLLALARGEVDLVVCRQPAAVPEGWVFEPLLDDHYVIACAPGHALLRRRRLRQRSAARRHWCACAAWASTRRDRPASSTGPSGA